MSTEDKLKAIQEIIDIAEEGMASIDPSSIILSEQHRLSLTDDMQSKLCSPMTLMFYWLADTMCKPETDMIVIDGTGPMWEAYSRANGELTHKTSEQLVNHPVPPEPHLKPNLQVVLSTYYLLRHYHLANIVKYAIKRSDEGFVVYVNDPENDHVWAAHRV